MSDTARRILLVEDDAAFRKVYGGLLRDAGFVIDEASDRGAADQALRAATYPVVLLDLMLPPDGTVDAGIDQLRRIVEAAPHTQVIVASGAGDTDNLVRAVRAGAYDFLTKPVDPDVLEVVVDRAFSRYELNVRLEGLQGALDAARPKTAMVGASPVFMEAVHLAERVAQSGLPVLVTGENGTGKELMARAVHEASAVAEGPFVPVNCGALPESLAESMLFGHVKGAFTGAARDHPGLFVEADGGTLFLDEVGDMPPLLQVKVLRALESGEILPVGAGRPKSVSVRIVSATNRDLEAARESGDFREDLYWRLKGVEIHLPPLRARPEDVGLLARHFLNACGHLCANGRPRHLSPDAEQALLQHDWPGNLRELRHEMQRATVMAGARHEIEPQDLSIARRATTSVPRTLAEKVERLEREEIEAALRRHGDNRTHAARELGLSRQGLLKKLERFALTKEKP